MPRIILFTSRVGFSLTSDRQRGIRGGGLLHQLGTMMGGIHFSTGNSILPSLVRDFPIQDEEKFYHSAPHVVVGRSIQILFGRIGGVE